MGIIEFLNLFPDVVKAAVLASLLTVLGVILTNKNNNKRLSEQLKYDSMQRDREREMLLRRDIYLPTIEEISNGLNILMSIIKIDYKDIDTFSKLSVNQNAIGKLFIIANEDTIKSVIKINNMYLKAYVKMLIKKMALMKLTMLTDMLAEKIDLDIKKKNELEVWLYKNADNPEISSEYITRKMELEEIGGKIKTWSRKLLLHRKDILVLNKDYILFSFDNMLEYIRMTIPVYICLRKELEMPIDENVYNQMMADTIDVTKEEVKLLVRNIEDQFMELSDDKD